MTRVWTNLYLEWMGNFGCIYHIFHVYCKCILDKFLCTPFSMSSGILISFCNKARSGKSLPAVQSHIDEWALLPLHYILVVALLPFISNCNQVRVAFQYLTCNNMSGNKSGIPKGPFLTLTFLPKTNGGGVWITGKDRVIHQAPIKAFRWSQHYRAVFLGDDWEGEWNILKTNLSRGIIFIFMMTLQLKKQEAKQHISEPFYRFPTAWLSTTEQMICSDSLDPCGSWMWMNRKKTF